MTYEIREVCVRPCDPQMGHFGLKFVDKIGELKGGVLKSMTDVFKKN